jgi:hypothetical protein
MPKQAHTPEGEICGKETFFRPPDDVEKMLVEVEQATGATRATLCIGSLRESLPKVVRRIDRERSKRARKFVQKFRPQKIKL